MSSIQFKTGFQNKEFFGFFCIPRERTCAIFTVKIISYSYFPFYSSVVDDLTNATDIYKSLIIVRQTKEREEEDR